MDGNKTNLIVNYLPQSLTDEEFRDIFLSVGALRATKIVRDRSTGYSYGFGFVDYVDEKDAEEAITRLNGIQLQNKRIKVAYSRNHDEAKGANLYVRNLPRAITQEQLKELFSNQGTVVNCRILCDQFTGQSKGVGFVLYDRRTEAEAAIQYWHNKVPPSGTEALNVKHAEENMNKVRMPMGDPEMMANDMQDEETRLFAGMGRGAGGPIKNQRNTRFNPMAQVGNSYMTGAYNAQPGAIGGYTLFVYNIGTDADERSLWQLFSPFGLIEKVNCMRDQEKDCCKGYGFVTFVHYHEAANAVQALNGYKFRQKPLQVSFKQPKY